MWAPGALIAASMALWCAPADAAPVRTAEAACAIAKARLSGHRRIPSSRVAACETIRAESSPDGYYLLALYGRCEEPVCGSTLMGWFAVRKSTGRLFQWNLGEWSLGPPIGTRP